jgi:hypothetical protein
MPAFNEAIRIGQNQRPVNRVSRETPCPAARNESSFPYAEIPENNVQYVLNIDPP